jgi:DNA repair protein RadA/Sms
MAKNKIEYVCQNCGSISPKWMGKCPDCSSWGTYQEEVAASKAAKTRPLAKNRNIPIPLSDISFDKEDRLTTNIVELDRVLGGGFIHGSIVLIGGDPGIGKSTLTLQASVNLAAHSPIYVTGEESPAQIKYRAERLGMHRQDVSSLKVFAETNLEAIAAVINREDTGFVVIDSIQSIYTDRIESAPGSVSQVRECTAYLMQLAKVSGITILIIGHITKEGAIAGPKILEHMVDTVLQFEGDRTHTYRILRSIKNRYGAAGELGIFDMTATGLEEVSNPSDLFLSDNGSEKTSGIAIVPIIEGSRPLLVEVQALVTDTNFSVPQRTVTGLDMKRLQIILAVLEKRLGAGLSRSDVFVNVVGGLSLSDPAADLGVASAIYSSFRDDIIESGTAIVGEIGLTGEVRPVSNIDRRIAEAEKLGFERIIIPQKNYDKLPTKTHTITIQPADRVSTAFALLI